MEHKRCLYWWVATNDMKTVQLVDSFSPYFNTTIEIRPHSNFSMTIETELKLGSLSIQPLYAQICQQETPRVWGHDKLHFHHMLTLASRSGHNKLHFLHDNWDSAKIRQFINSTPICSNMSIGNPLHFRPQQTPFPLYVNISLEIGPQQTPFSPWQLRRG